MTGSKLNIPRVHGIWGPGTPRGDAWNIIEDDGFQFSGRHYSDVKGCLFSWSASK